MFKKINISQSIKATDEGNYTIDQTDKVICYSNGSTCNIYSKEALLNENEKAFPIKKLQLGDTIMFAKFLSQSSNTTNAETNSEYLITNDFNYKLSIFNVPNSYQLEHQFEPGNLKTWKFALSPNGKSMATGAYSIFLYDIPNHSLIKEIDNHNKFIYSMIFLKDDYLAVGNSTGSINIFNLNTGKNTRKIEEHCMCVRSMAYNANDNKLFSASDDLHINVIDTVKYNVLSPIVGHKDFISTLIYNDSSHLLYSASYDGTIKVWDEKTGYKNIATICDDKTNPIWDMSVSSKGDTILYAGEEYPGAFQLK